METSSPGVFTAMIAYEWSAAPKGIKTPSFLVFATKYAPGANLDRIQIVKGWVDAKGAMHDKVFDVAWYNDYHLRLGNR